VHLDHRDLWVLRVMVEILVLLDHLVPKEELVSLVYLGNLVNLELMEILVHQVLLVALESVDFQECLEYLDLRVIEDSLDLMEQKVMVAHLVRKERMDLLDQWELLVLWDLQDQEGKEEEMDLQVCLDQEG